MIRVHNNFLAVTFALLSALVFGWYATRYKMVDHYRGNAA